MSYLGQARLAKRVDANQRAVINELQTLGALVAVIGVPADLLVGWNREWITLEVKDGAKPPSARRLTKNESTFFGKCLAWNLPHFVVTSPREAIDILMSRNRRK
jgi:hypothetical protein